MKTVSRGSAPGYTTVELIVAMLIGAVLMAIAVPQVMSMVSGYRLQGAVDTCTWAIQSTRYQSLEQGLPYRIVFSSAAGTYQIQYMPSGATTYSNVGTPIPLAGVPVALGQDTTVQFKPNGSVSATTGALTFQLSYQGVTKTVTVSTYGNITLS